MSSSFGRVWPHRSEDSARDIFLSALTASADSEAKFRSRTSSPSPSVAMSTSTSTSSSSTSSSASSQEETAFLKRQMEVVRAELRNVRAQIQGLRQSYRKDVDKIRELMKGGEVSTGEKKTASLTFAEEGFCFRPIGRIRTQFQSKNGTPRQPTVAATSTGVITLQAPDKKAGTNMKDALDGIKDFSHVWLLFVFDRNGGDGEFCKAKVEPPRCKGRRVGLFSTRSPHRPNPIGLTLAKIDRVDGADLHLRGLDLLDGTPILDIKPYIPAYDAPSSSSSSTSNVRVPSWINNPGDDLQVELTPRAERGLAEREFEGQSDRQLLRRAIVDILSADPRSHYRREKCSDRVYFVDVLQCAHVTAWFDGDVATVLKVEPLKS